MATSRFIIAARAWIDRTGGDSKSVRYIELPLSEMTTAVRDGRVATATMDVLGDPLIGLGALGRQAVLERGERILLGGLLLGERQLRRLRARPRLRKLAVEPGEPHRQLLRARGLLRRAVEQLLQFDVRVAQLAAQLSEVSSERTRLAHQLSTLLRRAGRERSADGGP